MHRFETPTLLVLRGLPGSGKTTVAQALGRATGAVHLRIDTIEQALRRWNHTPTGEGYTVGQDLATDLLRLGQSVIADCVNPWPLTRREWRDAGERAGAVVLDVEIACIDRAEHRTRVETRVTDIAGLALPDWAAVENRDYVPSEPGVIVVDTAGVSVDAAVANLLSQLENVG